MSEIDPIIHQPARLRIMAALDAIPADDALEFTALRELLGLTDGNLGAHLLKLEDASYVNVKKAFVRRKPKTYIALSKRGRSAFLRYRDALQDLLGTN